MRQHSGPDVHTTRSALCFAPPPRFLRAVLPPARLRRPAEPDTFVRHFASLRVPTFVTLRCFPGLQCTTRLPCLPPPLYGFPDVFRLSSTTSAFPHARSCVPLSADPARSC